MTVAQVLVVGLDPAKLQGWDPEPIQAAIVRGRARFDDHGIEADWCLVALDENPEGAIVEALTGNDYGCVVIGGGIRRPEPLLELFEKVVNLVRHAPDAAIAFNRWPATRMGHGLTLGTGGPSSWTIVDACRPPELLLRLLSEALVAGRAPWSAVDH